MGSIRGMLRSRVEGWPDLAEPMFPRQHHAGPSGMDPKRESPNPGLTRWPAAPFPPLYPIRAGLPDH